MGLFDIFRRRAKRSQPESAASAQTSEQGSTSLSQQSAPSEVESQSTVAASADTSVSEVTVSLAASTSHQSVSTPSAETAGHATPETSRAGVSAPSGSASSAAMSVGSATTSSQPTSLSTKTVATTVSQAAETSVSAVSTEHPTEVQASTAPATPSSDEQLYDQGLKKTRHTFGERLNALLANFRHVDEGFFDDLEETLIGADVGFDMAVKLSDELRDEVKLQNAKKAADVQNVIVEKMVEIYDQAGNQEESNALTFAKEGPTVILFVGVNGVGKTTTIGKMANQYHQAGKKVLLAAADTFRAGATEQLNVWAQRADVDIVTGKPQADPAAVVFDAVQKAKNEDYDILFVDTAGRLQNKVNLMNELAKMKRVITREIPTAPHEVLLVLDATTGQNALTQAKLFKESTDVTGIVLTKLDGTARGGIVLAIRNELHVPVKFIGLGEQINDLRPFDPNEFVYGLFKGLIDVSALDRAK